MNHYSTRIMSDAEFDPQELEPGIRNEVVAMRTAGFDTVGSCEGGAGHPHEYPIVFVWSKGDGEEEKRLIEKWSQNYSERSVASIFVGGSPTYTGRKLISVKFFNERKDQCEPKYLTIGL